MSVLESFKDGVRTTRDGAILEITLDRPKANAIDLAASRRLNDIVTAFRDDPSCWLRSSQAPVRSSSHPAGT